MEKLLDAARSFATCHKRVEDTRKVCSEVKERRKNGAEVYLDELSDAYRANEEACDALDEAKEELCNAALAWAKED